VPISCRESAVQCGIVDDGCGGTLSCDACTPPYTCGGGGLPNACGCRPPTCQDGTTGRRIGFWLTDHDIFQEYDEAVFFNAYFLTEPHAAFLEMIIDTADHAVLARPYFDQVAAMADGYPTIEMAFMCARDMAREDEWDIFESLVNTLARHSSVAMIGIDGEHAPNNVRENMLRAKDIVEASGKVFVSYYIGDRFGSGFLEIGHTNFPAWNDFEGTLGWFDNYPPYIGISSGGYYNFDFPEPRAFPEDPTIRVDYGWNREIVQSALFYAVQLDDVARHAVVLCPGFSNHDFVGVSGQTTRQLWDNETFRQWVAEAMEQYPDNWITSN
jgi:hypothetical protein